MTDQKIILPKDLERELNSAAKNVSRPKDLPKVFIGLPNLCMLNAGLVAKMFAVTQTKDFQPWFHILPEKRHADYARNVLAQMFMKSPCDYFSMIDADVDPHANFFDLVKQDKDIVSALVFCWINSELLPSIWERADCEQCRVLKVWMEEGKVHDPSQYRSINDEHLLRWDPFHNTYLNFATRKGINEGLQCRCKGTGLDPFVYRAHRKVIGQATFMECDSVGSACMIIARRVMEKMPFPWFSFLYRQSREMLLTEDHYFCWKAKEQGFSIWAEPQMVCSHYKTVDLTGINVAINKAYLMGLQAGQDKGNIIIPTDADIAAVAAK